LTFTRNNDITGGGANTANIDANTAAYLIAAQGPANTGTLAQHTSGDRGSVFSALAQATSAPVQATISTGKSAVSASPVFFFSALLALIMAYVAYL
jgi:hypothetical protein